MIKPGEVVARFDQADNNRRNWENSYQHVFQFFFPERDRFYVSTDGDRENTELFSSLPVRAGMDFATNLQDVLTPYGRPWLMLDTPGNMPRMDLTQQDQVALSHIESKMQEAVDESNFALEMSQCYLDLAAGTCCIKVETSKEPNQYLRFTCIPLTELYLERGYAGRATNVFRKHLLTIREAMQLYGDKFNSERHIKDGESLSNIAAEQNTSREDAMERQIELIEYCIGNNPATGKTGAEMPANYECGVVDKALKETLVEQAENTSPYIVTRWSVVSPQVYGRGPAWMALPDVKALNKLIEYIYRRTYQGIAPPWMVTDDGVLNPGTVTIEPDVMLPVRDTDGPGGPPIVPLNIPGDFQLGLINQESLQQDIKEQLFSENLRPLEGGTKSREEVLVRHQEYRRRVGAIYPRLLQELLRPLVKRCIDLLSDSGLFADKDTVGQYKAKQLVYRAPMGDGERQQMMLALEQFVQMTNAVVPGGAAVSLKVGQLPQKIANWTGLPLELVNDPEKLQQMAEALGSAAEQMQAGQAEGQQLQVA